MRTFLHDVAYLDESMERMLQTRRHVSIAAAVLGCLMALPKTSQAGQRRKDFLLASDVAIREMLAQRVETLAGPEDGIGIVVGLVGPRGRRVISYGHLGKGDRRSLNGDTDFEIGSVTKVFTALLLADMVRKGEVALSDPVARYVPSGIEIPERNGRSITLLDLATHTSGLPFMPEMTPASNDATARPDSPAEFYRFLARYRLTRDIGAEWDYSNVGYWLLSQALANPSGTSYEALLQRRVLAPLKLTRTAFTPSPGMKTNLAVGHDAALQPSPSFATVPIYKDMPAAGGLVSTANDLLTLLAVAMGYEPSQLAPAMATMLSTRRPMPQPGQTQALGWVVLGEGDERLIVHDGGTWGYASSVAWDPATREGVVALSNQMTGVDDIARHLLRPEMPLAKPTATRHEEIAVDAETLDAYAGSYEAKDEAFVVVRERDFLDDRIAGRLGPSTIAPAPGNAA